MRVPPAGMEADAEPVSIEDTHQMRDADAEVIHGEERERQWGGSWPATQE